MAGGLIARWRRRLAPPPSPALEQFLGWLATTPYAWQIGRDGKLRAREQGAEMCPVTGVVRHRTRAVFGLGDWVRAADTIGLSYADACLVVQAADAARPSSARVRRLRRRLLLVARVGVSAPARDPMDLALADLLARGRDVAGGPIGARPSDEERVAVSLP
jgi:hypothetical protein